jgi:hypothetical protein
MYEIDRRDLHCYDPAERYFVSSIIHRGFGDNSMLNLCYFLSGIMERTHLKQTSSLILPLRFVFALPGFELRSYIGYE